MKNWVMKKFKHYLGWSTSKKWYPVVLILSSLYVFYYRYEIYDFSQLNARNLIFLLWLLVLLLPLFSEFEFMGIKVKREIEKVSAEVRESTNDLKLQMMQLQVSNSIATNINVGNTPLPNEEKVDELLKIVRDLQKTQQHKFDNDNLEDEIDDSIVYLFKVRLTIENRLKGIHNKYLGELERPYGAVQIARILYQQELISNSTYNILREILNITNRAVHGEMINDKYIELVRESYPQIMSELSQLRFYNNP